MSVFDDAGAAILRPTHELPPRHMFEGLATLEGIRFWALADGERARKNDLLLVRLRPARESLYDIGVAHIKYCDKPCQKGWAGFLHIWNLRYNVVTKKEIDEQGWYFSLRFCDSVSITEEKRQNALRQISA